MESPRVFIGSSTEGLAIAEAVFGCLNKETTPTLWTHQLFLPGQYPLEVLEKQLKRYSFAIIVASPDDELIKRGLSSPAMRDNLLLEFGLFTGALGRRRTFFVCPSKPRIDLPSDLFGILTATYDADRVSGEVSERAAAVQSACLQIKGVISEEWSSIQRSKEYNAKRLRTSEESQAVQRLFTVAVRLRDALMAVQRDAFAAFSDKSKFELVKKAAAAEGVKIAESFKGDATKIGVNEELESLLTATNNALIDLPFPEELSLGKEEAKRKAMNIGLGALDAFFQGGDPMRHVEDATTGEVGERLIGLSNRYSDWWGKHSPPLKEATSKMQDSLMKVMFHIASQINLSTDEHI